MMLNAVIPRELLSQLLVLMFSFTILLLALESNSEYPMIIIMFLIYLLLFSMLLALKESSDSLIKTLYEYIKILEEKTNGY